MKHSQKHRFLVGKKAHQKSSVALSLTALTACGGGDGSNASDNGSNETPNTGVITPLLNYQTSGWTESEYSEGWWYAGEYNEPQLVYHFPQAASPVDIDNDGDIDLIVPMNRGYRTGVDSRFNFQVLENVDGRLILSAEKTEVTPFVAGARRSDEIYISQLSTKAFVTIAHDTAIETETRWDIPWRLGDLTITTLDPFESVAAELLGETILPSSVNTGRQTSVDAHAMAIGDVNRDGLDDILIGEFSGTYALLQTADGNFELFQDDFLASFSYWKDPDFPAEPTSFLLDLHMADLDGDGFDDVVVGWGHSSVNSRVFFNSEVGYQLDKSVLLPSPVYGAENHLHMNTYSADFDTDGDIDLIINQSRNDPYYGGTYLQLLINDGAGNFTDRTSDQLVDPLLYQDTFGERLEWTDAFTIGDVDGDGDLDIMGRYVSWENPTPIVFVNDGNANFTLVEITMGGQYAQPLTWGDFDQDGLIEFVAFQAAVNGDPGQQESYNYFEVYELNSVDFALPLNTATQV